MIFKQSTPWTHQFLMVDTGGINGATGKTVTVKLGKNGATGTTAAGAVSEVDSTNLPGTYAVALTAADTGTLGSLALAATASGCNPTNEFHRVDAQIFTDINLDTGTGRVKILSGVQQNTSITIMFPMTILGVPTPGLIVTGNRNFGSGFTPIAGTITELAGGDYKAVLTAADTNASAAIYRFTASGADDRNIALNLDP